MTLSSALQILNQIVIICNLYAFLTKGALNYSRWFVFQPYKFNADEIRAFKECNRESFYQRSLPIGTFLGLGTFYAVKAGLLTILYNPMTNYYISVMKTFQGF